MKKRPRVIPVFLPPAVDRGSLIDPPRRAPCADPERWLARLTAQVDRALADAPRGRGGKRQIGFFGGSFGALDQATADALLAAAARYRRARRVASLRVTLDPPHAAPAALERLAAAGVSTVEIDAASFDDDALAACRLPWRAADATAAVAAARDADLRVGLVLRPGMPGGAPGELVRSARRAAELAPDFVRIYPVLVFAGSPLAEAFERRRYRPLTLDEAVHVCREQVRIFADAKVPVGRIGLQPAVDLDGGATVIAGPHHPALRHLVESGLWLERAMALVTAHFRFQKELTLFVAPVDESRLRGPHGENVRRLREKFRLEKLVISLDARLPEGSLELELADDAAGGALVRKAG